jgi:hypothetical protein
MKKIKNSNVVIHINKKIIEVQINMLNSFGIKLFYKMVWWFDGQNIDVEPKKRRSNPSYQHILWEVCIFIYKPLYTCVNV